MTADGVQLKPWLTIIWLQVWRANHSAKLPLWFIRLNFKTTKGSIIFLHRISGIYDTDPLPGSPTWYQSDLFCYKKKNTWLTLHNMLSPLIGLSGNADWNTAGAFNKNT